MSDTDKKAEDIIEETMREIYDDLYELEAFEEEGAAEDAQKAPTENTEEILLEEDSDYTGENLAKRLEDTFGRDDAEPEEEIEGEEEFPELDEAYSEDRDFEEEFHEEGEVKKEKVGKKHQWVKRAAIVAGSIVGALVVVYIALAIYFNSHFMFNTKINGTDFAMKNVSQVEEYMEQQVADYILTLEKSDGTTEQISGSSIALEYVPGDELESLVKGQNNFLWLKTLWDYPDIKAKIGVKYDESALGDVIKDLDCMDKKNQEKPVNAKPKFQDTQFVIVPEVMGTKIDTEKFNAAVAEAINGFSDTLNLSEKDCYVLPTYVSDSEEVIKAAEKMNSYLGAEVIYDFGDDKEVVDSSVIAKWVKVSKKMKVTFKNSEVKKYIESLADKYNTLGRSREFTTAEGNKVTVEGGNFGWRINQEAEYKTLISNIKKAKKVTREPEYSSKGVSHGDMDVGNTYAEVDLTKQKMYYIKDGSVALETGVVTGNPNKGNATPQGVYSIAYKQKNRVLRGTKKPDGTYEYETPVAYWMPFNGGIGFHDATWQPTFGGTRYKSHGSHGCVNMPKDKAAQLYEMISAGTPVVCHY